MPSGLLAGLSGGMQGYAQGKQKETDLAVKLTMDQLDAEIDADMKARIEENRKTERAQDRTDKLEAGDTAYNRELGLIAARKDPLDTKLKQEQLNALLEDKKIPPAVKAEYASLDKLIQSKQEKIDNATATGSGVESGIAKLSDEISAATKRQQKLLSSIPGYVADKPEPTPEVTVKYDAQGRAWVKGADGKPVLRDDAAKAEAQSQPGIIAGAPTVTKPRASEVVAKAREIAASYPNGLPSRYMSGGPTEKQWEIIDAARKIGWGGN